MSEPIVLYAPNFSTGKQMATRYGVHEITLTGDGSVQNPFATRCTVTFTPPSGKKGAVTVDAFYDGEDIWRARVYVTETRDWKWRSQSEDDADLDGKRGSFPAQESTLRGMLRPHSRNPKQWMTDDGEWFLHLNDTAYMLFKKREDAWQEYVQDVWGLGITSVRVLSLGGGDWEGDTEDSAWPWQGEDYTRYNLDRFETTDERLQWMLCSFPHLYIQLILFGLKQWGKDNTGPEWEKIPPTAREDTMRYMLARWAAFPQLFWLVVNDIHADEGFPHNQAFVREVGRYLAAHDPWQHLLSSGQKREMPFPFLGPEDDWGSYIHIEDLYALDAEEIHLYDKYPLHVFLGEDRYEHDRYTRDPLHPAYYFRWLFWSWLLSGGSASYGGRWRYAQPYRRTGEIAYDTGWGGPDEHTYTEALQGLDSAPFLKHYFDERQLDLSRFTPDDTLVADADGRTGLLRPKGTHRDGKEYLIYHPNAVRDLDKVPGAKDTPEALRARHVDVDAERAARVRVDLRGAKGKLAVEWYRAEDGATEAGEEVEGGDWREFTAPWKGCDVVLRLH